MMKMATNIKRIITNWGLRKISAIALVFLFCVINKQAISQVAPQKYWVQFTDKNNSPYSISNPSVYLSQRAIDRRAQQNITITVQDFPVNPIYIQTVKQTASVTVLLTSKWLNGMVIQSTDTLGMNKVKNLPFIDPASFIKVAIPPTGIESIKIKETPYIDNLFKKSMVLTTNYGLSETQNKMIHVDYLHEMGYTGKGMIVAVLDAGFSKADITPVLESVFNENRILSTWDFVLNQAVDFSKHSNHGTSVLTCMAANSPDFYVGSAPDASYLLLRTEDADTENIIEEYNWVAGAEFADSAGADVFNTSLGYTEFDDASKSHTYADLDGNTTPITIGADIAASKGILVINSAGNSGNKSWRYIGAPADGDSVLTIGAVYSNRSVTAFSSRGPSFDGRVKPNVMAMGGAVPMPNEENTVNYIDGTSFSGPILTGAAACLWQSRPTYSSMEIYHAIEESADRYSMPNDDYGYGIPNVGLAYYCVTGIDNLTTHGNSIIAYPNPTNSYAYFPVTSSNIEIIITNLLGKVVYSTKSATIRNESCVVDFSSFPNGVYIVELKSAISSQLVRLVKN